MLRLDAVFPTIEQEAPHVASAARAVEVFTQEQHVYLRVGPVEGVDPAHGPYTLLLTNDAARKLADALVAAAGALGQDVPHEEAAGVLKRAPAPDDATGVLRSTGADHGERSQRG
jgi:hypothetical protein